MNNNSENKRSIAELVIASILTALMTLAIFNLFSVNQDNKMNNTMTDVKTETTEPGNLP